MQQHVQGLERVAVEGLKNDLTRVKAEHSMGQDQLQKLTDEHTQLKGAHEVVCTRVKELEESCGALQGEKSDLKTALLEAEADHAKVKKEHEERILAISDELKRSEEGRSALQADLEEVTISITLLLAVSALAPCLGQTTLHDLQAREQHTKMMQAKDAAAAEFEAEAAKSHTTATSLHAEIESLRNRVQDLQKETVGMCAPY